MLQIALATYGAVFVAEIVGDKLLYTTGVLATRYRSASVVIGMALAFMCKMAVAIAIGAAISQLPRSLVAVVTGASFVGVAIAVWRKPDVRLPKAKDSRVLTGALVAFLAIFLSEWGDVGQITAATMAARFGSPLIVWVGAVAAMATKGILAAYLGAGVRRWIGTRVSPALVRTGSVSLLLVLGAMAVVETLVSS